MNASQEILTLLQAIQDREWGRSFLARWLAENSLRFLESPNEVDRMIVADLDAALGEIQRGAQGDDFLVHTANQLLQGLGPAETQWEILIDTAESDIDILTGTANRGLEPMAQYDLEYPREPARV